MAGLAAAAVGLVVVLATSGSERQAPDADEPADLIAPDEAPPERAGGAERPQATGDEPDGEPPPLDEDELDSEEREAARTVRAYVNGLDARDGAAVCALLAPGAIDEVELPRRRDGCAESLRASIGFRDPRGLPVWAGARVQGLLTVALDGERASVTATTLTRFADRDQPSIEDDVVHLRRQGGRWLIAKPSSTLYRAVGIADVPPRVLAPPK